MLKASHSNEIQGSNRSLALSRQISFAHRSSLFSNLMLLTRRTKLSGLKTWIDASIF